MSYKRVCDKCSVLFKEGDAVIIEFGLDYSFVESCRDCHDLQNQAYEKSRESVNIIPPPLGYHFYVEDEVMFPSYLVGAEGKLKLDFMYEKTNAATSRIQ